MKRQVFKAGARGLLPYLLFAQIITPIFDTSSLSLAQTQLSCEQVLAEAESKYQEGLLDESIKLANSCLSQTGTAEVQLARDSENFASVVPDAAVSWDHHDRPEAPVIGEYVSVYFPHPEWGEVSSIYATDAQPVPADGETWEFEVRSNIRDHIKIVFSDLQEVPAEFEIWLLDEALKVSQDLRKSPSYSYRNHDETAPKQLKLLVGRHEFIGGSPEIGQTIPQDFELAQNFPNPFNPSTTIRYGIPTAGDVSLKVYNLRGEEIATLVEESKEAGFHLAFWNGKTDAGQQVASGVYVYRVQAGGRSITKKLAFLK